MKLMHLIFFIFLENFNINYEKSKRNNKKNIYSKKKVFIYLYANIIKTLYSIIQMKKRFNMGSNHLHTFVEGREGYNTI